MSHKNGTGPSLKPRCPVCREYEHVHWDGEGDHFWCTADHKDGPPEVPGHWSYSDYETDGLPAHVLFRETPVTVLDTLRYDGRRVDLSEILAKPPTPLRWRVDGIVADGTLTVLSGESGAGKSSLAQAWCSGVESGGSVAGLACERGRAIYVDAEMGPLMFAEQRMRPTGASECPFEYIDAMGLDVSRDDDLSWLGEVIVEVGAKLVVIDSLRALTPSKSENHSDDMAPVLTALRKLSRETCSGIVVIHHKGDGEKFSRGSTAIKDQCDALFGLLNHDGESRQLTCKGKGKPPRYAPAPDDLWLMISPFDGGVVAADEPPPKPPKQHAIDSDRKVLDAIDSADGPLMLAEIQAETGLARSTARDAIARLIGRKLIEQSGNVFKLAAAGGGIGNPPPPPPPEEPAPEWAEPRFEHGDAP